MSDESVVIVGAGPTGLALAAELRRLGTPALLLDKLPAGQNTSRATVVHARTLEVLEPMGVSPRLVERGVVLHQAHMRERDKVLATIRFDDLPTAYPFILVCPQDRTEAALAERLGELGGSITRPAEVLGITPSDVGVEILYCGGAEQKTVLAEWLVGCDGLHSVVRQGAGIGFEGGNYEENFLLADVEMDWPLDRESLDIFLTADGITLVAPLPENRFRVIAAVKQDPPEHPSVADCQRLLDECGPRNGVVKVHSVVWSSRFRIQHRVATQLRKGRVLVCGDAAHVHSPAGGQGMNTGIQDAVSLAAVLHAAVNTGDESGFAEWEKKTPRHCARRGKHHGQDDAAGRIVRASGAPAARLGAWHRGSRSGSGARARAQAVRDR